MINRRELFQAGGALAAAGAASRMNAQTTAARNRDEGYPKLSMITRYSPQRLAFAGKAGYECVEIVRGGSFMPQKLSDSDIDKVLATAKEAGVRILSIEAGWINHIDRDPQKRRENNAEFVRCLELGHRMGCPFVGTLSGGMPGAPLDDQVKAFVEVLNEKYAPVCEKLNLKMGWENYPHEENFATVPATWEKVLGQVPSKKVGLEFDPSHLVRQFIDPVKAAWDFRDRIYGFHAKDTEIIQPVLQKVGIHGDHWWRYRIPGQGSVEWPKIFNVLLQANYDGAVSVEHEDDFYDEPGGDSHDELAPSRKRGFVLARNFIRQYLPAPVR